MFTVTIRVGHDRYGFESDSYDDADDRFCRFLNNKHDHLDIRNGRKHGTFSINDGDVCMNTEMSSGELYDGDLLVGAFLIIKG